MNKDEFLKQWHELKREELTAQIAPESANDEQRTVDVIFFTGADVDRYSWIEGAYILKFDPAGADFSLLNNGAPICDNHWMSSVEDQKGRVDKAWMDSPGKPPYKATLRFKRSTELTGKRPDCDGLWQDVKDGIVSKFSMGVEILESIDQRDKNGQLEVRTATSWRPFEISLAPIPADYGTTTLNAQPQPKGIEHEPIGLAAAQRARDIAILRLK